MLRKTIVAIFVTSSLLSIILSGCGNNLSDESVPPPTTPGSSALSLVGATICIDCHKDVPGDDQLVSGYMAGKHVIHSSHITATSGDLCLGCHDPLGDGEQLNSLIIPSTSLAAVSCEACHGLGSDHYGYGALPEALPDYHVCGQCHTKLLDSHLPHHPEADEIYEDFSASAHAQSHDHGFSNIAKCNKCHTDEGARAYASYNTVALLETAEPVVAHANPIQCRTCHDSHETELIGASYNSPTVSSEYATCTSCHQAHDAALTADLSDPTDNDGESGELIYHGKRWDRVITTTHYDDPLTTDRIEGYTMSASDERVCRNCHNVHSADITINQQWAKSGHGGHILEGKENAAASSGDAEYRTLQDVYNVKYNAVTEQDAAALIHYNWDGPVHGSTACQRCHTSTGSANYFNDPANYNPAKNDYSHLEGWSADYNSTTGEFKNVVSSGQNEMIYCWACHAEDSHGENYLNGDLRTPGNIIPDYNSPTLSVKFPDVGNSNVCVGCHGGRGNYETIVDTTLPTNNGRSKSHHLPAAGMMFSEESRMGYDYATLDYSDPGQFMHKYISRSFDTPDSGRGPCVTCHMGIDADHRFSVVEKETDDGGKETITTNINKGVCDACHTGSFEMTPEFLESRSKQFASAKELLNAYVAGSITNYTGSPIKYNTVTAEEDYGAFQNNLFLAEEHGAYAHNRTYAKRLIFDSIDWLDGNNYASPSNLDGIISIPTTTYYNAAIWFGWNEDGSANYNAVRP